MGRASILTLIAFVSAALGQAHPDAIVAKPLPDGCASYPGYDPETDIAGPWTLTVGTNAENPSIRGFGNRDTYSASFNPRTDPKPSLRWGHIVIPTRNDQGKRPLRCSGGRLEAYVPNDLTAAGAPTDVKWTPLIISPYPYDAGLMWKILEGTPAKPFEYYIDGEKQEGVWLGGYDNTTLWGFKYYPASLGTYDKDYYYMRLLGPDSADPTSGEKLKANETREYLRIGF